MTANELEEKSGWGFEWWLHSQTLDMDEGNGLELSVGPYYNVARPEGAARWQIRFGVNWLFP